MDPEGSRFVSLLMPHKVPHSTGAIFLFDTSDLSLIWTYIISGLDSFSFPFSILLAAVSLLVSVQFSICLDTLAWAMLHVFFLLISSLEPGSWGWSWSAIFLFSTLSRLFSVLLLS